MGEQIKREIEEFEKNKREGDEIFKIVEKIDDKKAKRIKSCCNKIEILSKKTEQELSLRASFCKERLCPVCQWRKSMKDYSNLVNMLSILEDKTKKIL